MGMRNCIGLFGTCGGSKWRDSVILQLQRGGKLFFNPQLPEGQNWTEKDGQVEAEHLAEDKVIMFVITNETPAYGSLAETGWAALRAEKHHQKIGFFIQLTGDKEMDRPRKLVQAHILRLNGGKEDGVVFFGKKH